MFLLRLRHAAPSVIMLCGQRKFKLSKWGLRKFLATNAECCNRWGVENRLLLCTHRRILFLELKNVVYNKLLNCVYK
jgi:hypothetical protein